jgi:hypothetical protein
METKQQPGKSKTMMIVLIVFIVVCLLGLIGWWLYSKYSSAEDVPLPPPQDLSPAEAEVKTNDLLNKLNIPPPMLMCPTGFDSLAPLNLKEGDSYSCNCATGATPIMSNEKQYVAVHGGNPYSIKDDVCSAAVHAGIIKPNVSNLISFKVRKPPYAYPSVIDSKGNMSSQSLGNVDDVVGKLAISFVGVPETPDVVITNQLMSTIVPPGDTQTVNQKINNIRDGVTANIKQCQTSLDWAKGKMGEVLKFYPEVTTSQGGSDIIQSYNSIKVKIDTLARNIDQYNATYTTVLSTLPTVIPDKFVNPDEAQAILTLYSKLKDLLISTGTCPQYFGNDFVTLYALVNDRKKYMTPCNETYDVSGSPVGQQNQPPGTYSVIGCSKDGDKCYNTPRGKVGTCDMSKGGKYTSWIDYPILSYT